VEGLEETEGFSQEQRSGLEARQVDHDRTLEAVHRLEAALAEAAPGREDPWREAVSEALSVLDEVTTEESDNVRRPDSLLSDLARNQPRLRNRARAIRLEYEKVRETVASLRKELQEHQDSDVDYTDVRQRLGWVLTALRHQRARESDLIYEAYFDAFNVELRHSGGEVT
jgi:DNA repair ATPase RecN